MTKLLSFAAGVLATVLFLGARSWLGADGGETATDATEKRAQPASTPAVDMEQRTVDAGDPLVRPPDREPVPPSEREPVVSREAIEREILERLTADLPDGWVSEIDPSTEAEGPRLGGVPHGEWRIRYPDGGITDVGHFVLGSRQGVWKAYDANGELWQTCTYVNGLKEGTLEQYRPSYGSWEYRRGELVTDD